MPFPPKNIQFSHDMNVKMSTNNGEYSNIQGVLFSERVFLYA